MQDFPLGEATLVGLSEAEAACRLSSEGPNELPREGRRNIVRIARDVLREPMFMFLVSAASVYLMLGERSEALLLSVFATTSVVITIVQEFRSERVLDALKDLSSPRAFVIRDGRRKHIAGRDVVRGDLVIISEGDRIPADGIVLRSEELSADESFLTGEAIPVRKIAIDRNAQQAADLQPGGDDLPYVFSGSLAVRGQGIVEVTATGFRSQIGKIGASLARIETEPPRLKAETNRLVRLFAVAGGAVCLAAFSLQLVTGHNWLEALLAGIALGMAMLPEEFPLVLTVFTVMGAWRMSQAHVLTRRAAAIEALGEATVLCTDKTGTLTENRMAIAEMRVPTGQQIELSPYGGSDALQVFNDLVSAGALASQTEPVDPMDVAFVALARRHEVAGSYLRESGTLEKSYGLTPKLLAVTNVWRSEDDAADLTVAAKGAPEAIAGLCQLPDVQHRQLNHSADEMARKGLRVLAIARAVQPPGDVPDTPHGFRFELLGLVGLTDPLRPSAVVAIKQCQTAGIRVVMITGDYLVTAVSIARSAGIDTAAAVNGHDIEHLDAAALQQKVRESSVFARITPTEKLRIVEALKANGEIVAMTGDGVNDGPSLKAAHIGIAMGGRGTDVAREAAALVLLNDDFGSIPEAVQLGRRIFDNLQKAMGFVLAIHIPIAGLALLPLLVGLPPILEPLHIAFLELIIDPVCSIAFESEPEDASTMTRPPRAASVPLMSFDRLILCVVQGGTVLVAIGALFAASLTYGLPANQARALVFGALIAATVALVLINRTFEVSLLAAFHRQNRVLWVVLAVATALFAITLRWQPARHLFDFGDFHGHDILIASATGFAVLLVLEGTKFLYRLRERSRVAKAA